MTNLFIKSFINITEKTSFFRGRRRRLILTLIILQHLLFLGGNTVNASLSRLTYFRTSRLRLILQHLRSGLLRLLLVDVLHQYTFVLENVTFRLHVQGMVEVTVDLLGFTVLFQQPPQYTHALYPQFLLWHTSVCGTLAFTETTVTSFSAGFSVFTDTGT